MGSRRGYNRRSNGTRNNRRNNDASPSRASAYNRKQVVQLNNDNTNRLRNQDKYVKAVTMMQQNIFDNGLSFLLSLKNQFQIYEKDAAILESRGAFLKSPNYQMMKNSGKVLFLFKIILSL
jgi:hypothetical protein